LQLQADMVKQAAVAVVAATRLQSLTRGVMARTQYARMRDESITKQKTAAAAAATAIQAVYRRYRVRKAYAEAKYALDTLIMFYV
jgi:hypothetical protein